MRLPTRTSRCVPPARARAAFTLVEVLMAAFIIALGVLGLLALFAGAARQQQSASLTTQSVFLGNSARAIITPKLGDLEIPNSLPQADRPIDGVWRRVPIDFDSSDPDFSPLSLDTESFCEDSPFLRRNMIPGGGRGIVLYEAPPNPTIFGPPSLVQFQNPFLYFEGRRDDPNWGSFQPLPLRGADPESMLVEIKLTDQATGNTRSLVFGRPLGVTLPLDQPGLGRFVLQPLQPPLPPGATALNTYIIVDTQGCRIDETSPEFRPRADISQIRLDTTTVTGAFGTFSVEGIRPNEYVAEVLLRRASARVREIIGLRDRVRFREDDTSETGRRADMTYSLLVRQSGTQTQVMAFTYTLTPTSRDAEWIPPERVEDYQPELTDEPPLREVDLELGFDPDLQQYFFEGSTNDEDDWLWALAPGQTILVLGEAPSTVSSAYNSGNRSIYPGADDAARVVRLRRINTGGGVEFRAYLDRGPRSRGESYLNASERTSPGARRELRCVAVNDVVEALAGGGEWVLSALSAERIR